MGRSEEYVIVSVERLQMAGWQIFSHAPEGTHASQAMQHCY
jgi:hypothetical protein